MKMRIYIDTSIVVGYFDEEFQETTRKLFQSLQNGKVIFVVSDSLFLELLKAPQNFKNLLQNYNQDSFEHITLTQEANELAETYIQEKVVGRTSLEDCRHIAMATIYKVDVLAS